MRTSLVAVATVVVAACSPATHRAAPSPPTATSAPSATTTTTVPDPPARALDCTDPIDRRPAPERRFQSVGGAVALETNAVTSMALQTWRSGYRDPHIRLASKTALMVRTGARAEVLVPAEERDVVWFEWGNTTRRAPTQHLVVGPCAGPGDWIVFPGGYDVARVGCYSVIVRAGGTERRVSMGVGVPCRGQRPPPPPLGD